MNPSSFPNADQSAVIEAVHESLLVFSPMGTGKTRTAAAAIRRAIESGIDPGRILGLTFTNRAAEAMRNAVAEALPEAGHRVHLFSLHGLCARLLREEGRLADLPPDFGILDEDESKELLWEFISRADRMERFNGKPIEALNAYEKFVFNFLVGKEVSLPKNQDPVPTAFRMYRDALHRDGNVDFTGLIARTHHLFYKYPEARARWQARFDWILVDEAQDVNLVEYRIIATMAGKGKFLKLFGDMHQTIYEWRFAQPQEVIRVFEREFKPRKLSLRINYRCARILVEISNAVRQAFIPSHEPFPDVGGGLSDGKFTLNAFDTSAAEVEGLVSQIATWRKEGIAWGQIGVLSRQNRTLVEISTALKTAKIPHLVAEDFDFFRRQEVKDLTALMEHLICPFRRHPILRLLKRFGANAGALNSFENTTQGTGLHLGYLLGKTKGDPLAPLIKTWEDGQVVALDTESNGLDPMTAEVIQFARVSQRPAACFADWIRPKGRVGDSVHIHGFTDEFLEKNGKDAHDVLKKGMRFEPGQILLGHNVTFDLRLLRNQTGRLGLPTDVPIFFDTMSLAAAILSKEELKGLRLEVVAKALGIEPSKTHDAEADAQTCLAVLERLVPRIRETQSIRLKLLDEMGAGLDLAFRKAGALFQQASELEASGIAVADLIPALWQLLRETPGDHDYRSNPARTRNIEDLAAIARFLEKRRGSPLSLPIFLEQVSLSRRDMLLEADPDRVRLLSAHAAKGLEFEAVALPRLIKPWPDYSDEEARVFYVMLTRARRHLWMSWPQKVTTSRGYEQRVERLKYLSTVEPFARRSA